MKISGDKSGNYKYYERNEYLFERQWENQREMTRPVSGRRVPWEISRSKAQCQYAGDKHKPVMVEVE